MILKKSKTYLVSPLFLVLLLSISSVNVLVLSFDYPFKHYQRSFALPGKTELVVIDKRAFGTTPFHTHQIGTCSMNIEV